MMRIASLVPSATEMLFELGLGDSVVAVTHECDWPAQAAALPQLTRSVIPDGLSAPEIDRTVRDTVARGAPLYELDRERLEELDPELIVTQAVCEVCAVSYDDVVAVAATLRSRPGVISLDPLELADVLADVRRLGEATGTGPAAERLLERAATRLDAVRSAVAGAPRPRVLALEWLEGTTPLAVPGRVPGRRAGRSWSGPAPTSSWRCPADTTPSARPWRRRRMSASSPGSAPFSSWRSTLPLTSRARDHDW